MFPLLLKHPSSGWHDSSLSCGFLAVVLAGTSSSLSPSPSPPPYVVVSSTTGSVFPSQYPHLSPLSHSRTRDSCIQLPSAPLLRHLTGISKLTQPNLSTPTLPSLHSSHATIPCASTRTLGIILDTNSSLSKSCPSCLLYTSHISLLLSTSTDNTLVPPTPIPHLDTATACLLPPLPASPVPQSILYDRQKDFLK